MIDTQRYPYSEPYRIDRVPGSDVHHMSIRLTLTRQLTITAIEVSMSAPYTSCPEVAPQLAAVGAVL
jgi:hypothetical protein